MSALVRLYRPLWLASTYRDSVYLLMGLLWGILWPTIALSLYGVGIGTAVIWIGVPILVITHRAMRWIGRFERTQVNSLLGEDLPEIPPFEPPPAQYNDHPYAARFGNWMHAVFHDDYSWRALAWVGIRMVSGPVGFAAALIMYVVLGSLVLAPLGMIWLRIPDEASWVSVWWLWGGPLAALVIAPLLVWPVRALAALHRMAARWALGPSDAEEVRAATQRAERAEQQVRIDQELHDSIGHMITMNIVQAGAGAHVFDTDPEFSRQALRNIEERGRAAMSELDRIVAAIRGDDAGPRAPLPGLAEIRGLVEASRAAGVDIDGVVLADAVVSADAVAPSLGRAAYAIVREGVTNAAKHAPGARVHVHVTVEPDAVCMAVVNGPAADGARRAHEGAPRAEATATRRGLSGIRDRAALLGGRSLAGPTDTGGWEVLALLPTGTAIAPRTEDDGSECYHWQRLRGKVSV